MNKAVIFDLDGTLLDTLPDIYDYVNVTLEKFGAQPRKQSEVRRFIGNGAKKLIERSFDNKLDEPQLKERLDFYNKAYTSSGSPKTKLFDGVSEVLKELKNRGYKLGILTNKPQITTDDVNQRYLKEFSFDSIIGQRDGVKCKPDPTAVLSMLKEMDVLPENAYFVGDGETDTEVSINANMNGIAVLWGYRDYEDLYCAGARTFCASPKELLNLIK